MISLACAATIMINLTLDPWNDRDYMVLERAKVVCSTDDRYRFDAPCVKSLTKYPENHYNVICGESQ